MDSRVCNTCNVDTPLDRLVKKSDCLGGYASICLKCRAEEQRKYRALTKNAQTKKYEKTLKGYLVRTYRNMLSRVNGIQKEKAHLYEGLSILDKNEFYDWSLSSNYIELHSQYVESGYDLKLAPSIDRIDSKEGYVYGNIRWITHSENSRLGALSESRNK